MYSPTPDIVPFPTTHRQPFLSTEQLTTLQGGTLQLLEEVGVV